MARKIVREAVIVLIETAVLLVTFATFGIPESRERLAFDGAPVTDQESVQSLRTPNVAMELERRAEWSGLLFVDTARPRLTGGGSDR